MRRKEKDFALLLLVLRAANLNVRKEKQAEIHFTSLNMKFKQ